MRVLIDEGSCWLGEELRKHDFNVETICELKDVNKRLNSDYSVCRYALTSDRILVTADYENYMSCTENLIPVILVSNDKRQVVVEKLVRVLKTMKNTDAAVVGQSAEFKVTHKAMNRQKFDIAMKLIKELEFTEELCNSCNNHMFIYGGVKYCPRCAASQSKPSLIVD